MSTNYINHIIDTANTTHYLTEGVDTRIYRATCSTSASTAEKTVTLEDSTGFSLTNGVRLAVTFTYGNSATSPKLNVDSTGAKSIVFCTDSDGTATGNGDKYNTWGPRETVLFSYAGTYWYNHGSSLSIYRAYALADSKLSSETDPTVPSWAKASSKPSYTASEVGAVTKVAGIIQMYAGSTAPSGWLLCDGSAVSRTTYATLFAVIGTTYGTGDGSTTFNLPNLTDRFPIGAGSTYSLNATGGSANAIIPYHNHTASGGAVEDKAAYDATLKTSGSVNSTNSSHAHTVSGRSVYNGTSNYVALTSNANRSTLYNSMDEGGSHTHSFTNPVYTIGKHGHSFTQPTISYEGKNADGTDASADNTANANLPPYIGINFIISTGD